eukprot:TRINITY_DN6424_c0_g1_i2.p1 TRINITY_DN6424_c0_g1~~TRINITY_DN6424_c0_g1_i2.p1  ORF type:complete len:260 (+),score=105.20 TRINITY_DN6424_c0_g1_i2:593-1372(+)
MANRTQNVNEVEVTINSTIAETESLLDTKKQKKTVDSEYNILIDENQIINSDDENNSTNENQKETPNIEQEKIDPLKWSPQSTHYPLILAIYCTVSNEQQSISENSEIDKKLKLPCCLYTTIQFINTEDTKNPYKPAIIGQYLAFETETYILQSVFGIEDSELECVVCLSEPKDTILLPCRHFSVCAICLSKLNRCPVCRSKIANHLWLKDLNYQQNSLNNESIESKEQLLTLTNNNNDNNNNDNVDDNNNNLQVNPFI